MDILLVFMGIGMIALHIYAAIKLSPKDYENWKDGFWDDL